MIVLSFIIFSANLFLSQLETKIIKKLQYFPRIWLLYVFDVVLYSLSGRPIEKSSQVMEKVISN